MSNNNTDKEKELKARQEKILQDLKALEERYHQVSPLKGAVENRVFNAGVQMGVTHMRFKRVAEDYYDWSLEERRRTLGAPSIHHLCKSIILENTLCSRNDCADPNNSKFYCVILQYTARLQSHKIFKFVRTLAPDLSKKYFHFNYAKEEDSFRLTGFEHNAICPIGTTERIPIILSHKIAALNPPIFWLGGGEVDLKLQLSLEEFLRVMQPFVTDVTNE